MYMKKNRSLILLSLFAIALLATVACSMNRQTPEALDDEALKADVKAAITAVAPGSGIGVDVMDGGHIKLSGHADNAAQRDAIVSRVQTVKGVTSVDASEVHVQ